MNSASTHKAFGLEVGPFHFFALKIKAWSIQKVCRMKVERIVLDFKNGIRYNITNGSGRIREVNIGGFKH
ncbi:MULTISPECIES: hypothetical protein [Bacillus]|jgi:hypothetical protein|uniref:hypothetical protein n=1 Tax=Bacillus TaxID=1386 RepID=UPI00065E09B2|nr:hypothetical protein [Bacillus smithii]AKP47312.1 hypothetical protein BSM4216_2060 [Bacillus smithii]